MFNVYALFLAIGLAIVARFFDSVLVLEFAKAIEGIFVNLLKLISLPLIFFSILSAFSGFGSVKGVKMLMIRVLIYTLFTTVVAAVIALILYLIISPSSGSLADPSAESGRESWNYLAYIVSIFPNNFVKIFLENNVTGCVLVAFLSGVGLLSVSGEKRETLYHTFSALFELLLRIAQLMVKCMPIAIFAFMTTLLNMPRDQDLSSSMVKYLLCVVLSNIIQAVVVLPLLLRFKGIPVCATVSGTFSALVTAFFSKSSAATLPVTMGCLNNMGVERRLASFLLPLCTTINMNACASFILITVLFVSEMNGYVFAFGEMLVWILLSVGAAVGNAGVPMGCYFMATSYLVAMKMPIQMMGLILPAYMFIDMLETAVNVWSDVCVVRIISKENRIGERVSDTN